MVTSGSLVCKERNKLGRKTDLQFAKSQFVQL